MTSTDTRWKIASLLNRRRRFCWADLVDYVLSWREGGDVSERQRVFWSTKDESGWITRYPMLDFLHRHSDHPSPSAKCQETASRTGSCYCGKFATKEVRDKTALRPKFIVPGTSRLARLEDYR